MPQNSSEIYTFAPLTKYSAKQRLFIRIADLAFYALIKLIGGTTRFEVEGEANRTAIEARGKLPIYVVWHDRIFLGTYYLRHRGIGFMTSQSFDGEYIARFIQRFGHGAVRGSSTRGGAKGLVEMIREMRRGTPMGFTVDGPKGPRYVAKSGPVLLAKKTGNPILPFVIEPRKYWTLGSWDKLQIPRLFASARVIFAEPIWVDADADDTQMESKLDELQRSLDDLVERAKNWRTSD